MLAALLHNLDADLCQALLPLAFESTWHSTGSLELAPDLPEGWFRQVTRALDLEVVDGHAQVPEALQQVMRLRLGEERPRLYRELAIAAAERAFAADEVFAGMTLLRTGGLQRQAEAALVAWISRHDLANSFAVVNEQLEALPQDWLSPRVRGAWGHAQVRQGGEVGKRARRQLQAAYDAGERDTEVMYALLLARNFDGQNELALALAAELLTQGVTGLELLRVLHQRAAALLDLGRRDEHRAAAHQLIEAASQQGRLDYLAAGHAALAYASEEERQWEEAEWHYERAIALNEQVGNSRQLVVLLNNYAQVLIQAGRPALARLRLEQLRPHLSGHAAQRAWVALTRAMLDHQYGEHLAAIASSAAAVDAAGEAHLPAYEFSARLIQAERLALDGQLEAARRTLREARSLLSAGDSSDAAAYAFTSAVVQALSGEAERASTRFTGLTTNTSLNPWDQVRVQLYLAEHALEQNQTPDLEHLERPLTVAGHDAPLRTDAPRLQRAMTWLAGQPGWAERLAAALETAPSGTVLIHFELCAPLIVHHQGAALRFPLQRSAELLAYLALHGPTTRQNLMMALLGKTDESGADHFKKILKGLRTALAPLLPPGTEPVQIEQRRYRLHPLLCLTTSWYPATLFPAATLQVRGPLTVTSSFLSEARGPWVESLAQDVHEELAHHLEAQHRLGRPDAPALLARVQALCAHLP